MSVYLGRYLTTLPNTFQEIQGSYPGLYKNTQPILVASAFINPISASFPRRLLGQVEIQVGRRHWSITRFLLASFPSEDNAIGGTHQSCQARPGQVEYGKYDGGKKPSRVESSTPSHELGCPEHLPRIVIGHAIQGSAGGQDKPSMTQKGSTTYPRCI